MNDGAISTLIEKGADPLISVVLPVYNGEKYLGEAIDSILAQTFANFELIVINDGSTDASQQILKDYEQRDPRLRVIFRENRGLATTLNDSIAIARGKFVARMDQDDTSHPERFEQQVKLMESEEADICGCHWIVMNENGKYIDARLMPLCSDTITICLADTVPFAHGSVMMRRSFIVQHELKYAAVRHAEDYDLWIRFYESGAKFVNANEFLFKYRDYALTLSKRKRKDIATDTRSLKWGFIRRNTAACLTAVRNLSNDPSNLSLNGQINLLLASYRVSLVLKVPIVISTMRNSKRSSIVMALIELLKRS